MKKLLWAALAVLLVPALGAVPAFPTTVAHKYGSTVVVKAPQRVVALGLTDQDSLLALGTVPVATREWFGKVPGAIFPWAVPLLGKAPLPQVLNYELDFEAIAALQPDLIVALSSALTLEEYKTLSKIAPTVAQPGDVVDWGVSWQASVRTMGAVLGKSAEAEARIAAVEKKVADTKKAHPQFVGKRAQVLSAWGWPNTYYAYSSQDARGRLLTSLGFQSVAEVDKLAGTSFGASISRERLNLIDLDLVLWMTEGPEQEKALKADSVWSQLKIAREGRAFFLPESHAVYSAFNFASVLSLPYAIDGLVPVFDSLLSKTAAR